MNKEDFFVNRSVRTKQIAKWFRESCNDYNKRGELRSFVLHYNRQQYNEAYTIIHKIMTFFINAYNSNGLIRIGYLLEKNRIRFGVKKVIFALMYGLTGHFLDSNERDAIHDIKVK